MNRFDFQVILHAQLLGDDPRYAVSMRHVNGARDEELRTRILLQSYPLTEEGYISAALLAQRLVRAVEEQTMPYFTGLPMAGLRVDYIRCDRVHEEMVE